MRVVPKEESQIRLSERGQFFHQEEPFENEKIIDFFHHAIRKDEAGDYFLYNKVDGKVEHVYFQVDDTAYFVADLKRSGNAPEFEAVLNTGAQVQIQVSSLFEDSRGVMYCQVLDSDRARVTPRALEQLADMAVMKEEGVFLDVEGRLVQLSQAGSDDKGESD